MTELHEPRQRPFGAVIEAAPDVEPLVAGLLEDGTESVELVAGFGHMVGLHLGTVPRHGIRDAFAQAGITVEAVAAPVGLNVEQPDEGVVADVDAYLTLAADLGALRLKLTAGSLPGSAEGGEPGTAAPGERISQRLAAVLGRAAELKVRLVVENSGLASGAEELAAVLEAATFPVGPATGDVPVSTTAEKQTSIPGDDGPSAGAAWNVRTSVAAGETPVVSAKLLKPYLEGGRGYILCESAAAATALLDAVPEMAGVPVLIEAADEPAATGH
ncbi:hypothetical protein [Arthrobacter sp. H14]|uniref:hypothetical protein n=1 Tax=Arthrobacter sp. H14 TaxID=1312959 RepID=UPI00047D6514|nr:hypothetical protein [Arthrobacter sp. H14]